MNRYKALLDEQVALKAEWGEIVSKAEAENRLDLTTEESGRVTEIRGRLSRVADALEEEEARRQMERSAPADTSRFSNFHDRASEEPWGYASYRMTEAEWLQMRGNCGLSAENPAHPARAYRQAALGEFLQAVYRANTGQGVDPRLTYVSVAQGASSAVGPDGGFLLRPTMQDDLKLRMAAGKIFSRISPIPLDDATDSLELNVIDETSRINGSRHGGVRGYWLDEGEAATQSRPKFRKYHLRAKGLAALGYAPNNLLRNARALGAIMTTAFGDELRFRTEDAIVNGNAVGKPMGLLSGNCLISQAKETGQAAATVVYQNITKMWSRLLPDLRENAIWLFHSDVEPQLDELAIVAGTGALEPRFMRYGLDGVLQIKGRPAMAVEYCATLGTVGDLILVALDDYGFIEVPIEEASSMHVAFTTNEMAFRVTYYCDGEPYLRSAITPFKGNTTQSSVVALATRS